jgi:hypothetical protein
MNRIPPRRTSLKEYQWPFSDPHDLVAELFCLGRWEEAGDAIGGAHKAANYLFSELIERVGVGRAKYIFRHFGKPPSKTDLNDRKNYAVLDRLDRMKDENGELFPNYLGLAKQLAPENQALPLEERKGPGGVDVPALAKHIENLAKRRERELAAGTWFGPITHEQTVRHFGARNVATIPKK